MAASSTLSCILICLLICRAFTAPFPSSNSPNPICSSAQLIAPGQGSWLYKYTTEVKLSVANAEIDLTTKISADVNIRSLNDCDYLIQLRNVRVTESRDDNDTPVSSSAQRELENMVVRFRWVDGYVIIVEADQSAKVDHVNFIKGILSTLHVHSPVPVDNQELVREEDILGVCTTRYKYSQKGPVLQINKNKDLSTCSKDKLHLSSSPVLTSLFGPMLEEVFSANSRYVCQTEIRDKKIQNVKCKTIEIQTDEDRKPDRSKPTGQKHTGVADHGHSDESDSHEDVHIEFNDRDNDEISSKLVFIKQELKLQSGGGANVDTNALKNPVRQTLQFVPTSSFAKSEETISALVSKIQKLMNTKEWDQFAASRFVEIANELRRMDRSQLNAFKNEGGLKQVVSTFLDTVYSHTPVTASLNLDSNTLKFANPLAVLYLDKPSKELVDQVVQASQRVSASQVPEFVGLAAAILKAYRARQDNTKEADAKIREFQRSISRLLNSAGTTSSNVTTTILAAYAQLGLFDDQVRRLASNDQASLDIQYHALNAIRHIREEYINDANQLNLRTGLQNLLLRKLQNKSNKNAIRIWAFEALYTPFIYNPETDDSPLADDLEKALGNILNEPLNQVNGFIWSALKYSSLDRLCPLRGLAARLRAHHANKKQFAEQATLSSRKIQLEVPLRKNYRAVIHACLIFENDRVVPSFFGAKLAFDGIRRETLRLPWIDLALISENLDYNFAEYFLNLDPLNKKTNVEDNEKEQIKRTLPPAVQQMQSTRDKKEEDPDPTVYFYMKLFGTDMHSLDVTNKVQDILKTNLRTFLRNQIMNRLKDLTGKDPLFRIPLEIGAASAAANGLTLYKSAQLGILADLTTELKNSRNEAGLGTFSLTSRSALSFSLTFQREVSSPLTTIGETVNVGIFSNVPFEYRTEGNEQGRIRELNLLNPQSIALATDFQYATRSSKGVTAVPNTKTATIDPSCTPSLIYRGLGIRACLEMNPFRSLQLGDRPSYPITITVSKDPSIKKWRIGWRFNAQDAPQYEVAVEKVGATGTYPGLGISATKTGNNFDIKVLTGMKSFNVKGTQNGNRFTGSVYSSDNKEVMTASGTLNVNADGFKLDTKLVDSASKKEMATLTTDINPNRGQGLTADIGLTTPDKSKSFKINFRGDIYKPNSQLIHVGGNFNLGGTTYTGKAHYERSDEKTRIEFHRSMKLAANPALNGYEFLYERKKTRSGNQNTTDIEAHLTVQAPGRGESKVLDFKTDFTRSNDLANATLRSSLDFLILTRNPPVAERIELDYLRRSIRTSNQAQRLVSPAANLKIQVKTKSNVFNFLVDHSHRRSSEPTRKGPETLPPTFEIKNKIHVVADTDRLLPDIPRPFAFDVSSDLDFQLLNKLNYKLKYDLRRRQLSGSFTYNNQVNRVTDGHLFSGTSDIELIWDNQQKKAKGTGDFVVCTKMRSVKTHLDIDTNVVADRNDITLDFSARVDRQPKPNAPKSLIVQYDVTFQAPKHELVQLIDLDGNITRQEGILEAYNSIAYRREKTLNEINVNLIVDRNRTGDGSFHTHIDLSLPFRNLPYITHDLLLQRESPAGRLSHLASHLLAKPVFAHYARVNIDRSKADQPPYVHVDNELEYLRGNGDSLYAMSKIDVHRWSTLHSTGLLRRNTDLLHRHSIGYIFSNKTRRVALSLESPQLSGNPLSIIGEITIDRDHPIGKMKWPQEFGVHLEFGTPLSNITALQAYYYLPMFHEDDDQTVDATIAFKLASSKITPIDIYFQSQGSLNTTLHVTESINIGDDIAMSALLTAQYNPDQVNQLSLSTSSKYYSQEFQNALYVLFKDHQMTVRGIINTTDNEDYKYEMDIGFDNLLLTGHTERTDGKQTTISDIEAKKCQASGKFNRCYRGDIAIRTGNSGGQRGTFDVSWGRSTAKLDVQVPSQVDIKFDHTHSGRLRDDSFSSKTTIDGKFLQNNNRAGFSYSGSVDKEDGRWNKVQIQGSATDRKSGQKSFGADVNLNQRISNKLTGQFQRDIKVNLEHKGQPVINWASNSASCTENPSNVLYGVCQNTNFNIKASNQFAQRLRQRLQLTADPKLSNPNGQVTYDGTLKLDLKGDPKSGPHTAKLDLNRMKEDAVDLDVSFQPRSEGTPMNLRLKANLPEQSPISVKYDETRRSASSFQGTLKYSFNANDNAAEKTFQCEVDGRDLEDLNLDCKGERTTLKLDIDRRAGKSIAYVTLNRFDNERIGYEAVQNPQSNELDATLYTLVSSWNIKRQPGKSITVRVQQKNQEVLRVEGTKVGNQEFQVKFSPSNVNLQLTWDNSTLITLKQTAPQPRNLVTITIDRERIRPYLPSLRNQDRPSNDIEETKQRSGKPLIEIALDTRTLFSLSEPLDKIGSHHGLYGLATIKKAFKLQIGDAPLTLYNVQHWKTHREDSEIPESYVIRLINNANGNIVQVSTNKWNENRLVSEISHSFDAGKTMTTDFKLNRNYAHQVGMMYFFTSSGYRNIQGVRTLRNHTGGFVREHLRKDLEKTNIAALTKDFRGRLRSILEKDYAAAKAIVSSWNQEAEKSFLRRFSNRLGLPDFFSKYPTYSQASDRIFAILSERSTERENFWRERFQNIINDNRLKDLAERIQVRRAELIKDLLDRAEPILDRFLPKADQVNIDKRIADYVGKLVNGFEQVLKRNTEQWKGVFRAIDEASKGEDAKWFRTLVADIDSNSFATATDAEVTKVIKKLGDSSKLLISNIQKISRGITKRQESIRERVKNAIRHIPNAYINDSNFELLMPVGREPGSYVGTSELLLGMGSLLRNRDQAFDTIRSILINRLDASAETRANYMKAVRSLAKRLFRRNPSLTPEYKAVIAQSGDAIDLHGEYIYLNPSCEYLLAHDFADLQFSFRFANGRVYSLISNQGEIRQHECSDTGRVQICNEGNYYRLNVPMYYGGRVDGALGDVRDRSGRGKANLSRWTLQGCSARDQPRRGGSSIVECGSEDDDEQDFCENYVQNGLRRNQDRRQLLTEVMEMRRQVG